MGGLFSHMCERGLESRSCFLQTSVRQTGSLSLLLGTCWVSWVGAETPDLKELSFILHLNHSCHLVHKENAPKDRNRSTEKTRMWQEIRQELNISVKTNCCGILYCGYLKRTTVNLRCACVHVCVCLSVLRQFRKKYMWTYTYIHIQRTCSDRLNETNVNTWIWVKNG